ncbi:MAG: S53 family peptidase [Myxococcota bacterium]
MNAEIPSLGTPRAVAQYYGFPLDKYDGTGQKIAILDLNGTFNRTMLLQNLNRLGVQFDDANLLHKTAGAPPVSSGFGETQEDVEVVASVCPGATITVYTGDYVDIVTSATKDGNLVITSSWTWGNDYDAKESAPDFFKDLNLAIKEAAKKGVILCCAAGDGSSSNCRNSSSAAVPAPDWRAHVNYPSSHPKVLAVGGTMKILNDLKQAEEVVWNNSNIQQGATGGGVSPVFQVPSYQQSPEFEIQSANPDGRIGRVIPDVAAFAAYDDYVLEEYGRRQLNGGTSAATPLWASLLVLVNQARHEAGKGPIKDLHKVLYSLSSGFHDIVRGNNRPQPNYPGYDAKPGFDACTGLGSPIAPLLVPALVVAD